MGVKTVLDFPEVTSPEDSDVLYAIRGTSAGRDKRITWANLKQFLAPLAHAASTAIYGQGTASAFGHVKVDDYPVHLSANAVSSGGTFSAIGDEALARENADSDITETLGGQISAEAATRANADSAEVTARTNADSSLQNQITANAANITKLWAPTSSGEAGVDPATLFEIGAAMMDDGRCVTLYWTATGGAMNVKLLTPYSTTKVFHLRIKLPTYNAGLVGTIFQLNVHFNSALDGGDLIMFNYEQKMAEGTTSEAQLSKVFTFVNGGANTWILM